LAYPFRTQAQCLRRQRPRVPALARARSILKASSQSAGLGVLARRKWLEAGPLVAGLFQQSRRLVTLDRGQAVAQFRSDCNGCRDLRREPTALGFSCLCAGEQCPRRLDGRSEPPAQFDVRFTVQFDPRRLCSLDPCREFLRTKATLHKRFRPAAEIEPARAACMCCRRLGRRRLPGRSCLSVQGLEQDARPARGDLGGGLCRHGSQGLAVRDPLDCCERDVLVLALERDGDDLCRIGEPPQGLDSRRGQAGAPCHGCQRLGIVQSHDCGPPDRVERRRLRHRDDVAHVLQQRERRQTLGFGRVLEHAEREVPQNRNRLLPDALIAIRPGDFSHQCRFDDLPHRRPPHAGVAVLPGDGDQNVLLVQGKLLDTRDSGERIIALPLWWPSESIEQRHC
jgi:hypothetical protein